MIRENTDEKMIPFNCDKSRRTHLQLVAKGTEEVNTILAVKRHTNVAKTAVLPKWMELGVLPDILRTHFGTPSNQGDCCG